MILESQGSMETTVLARGIGRRKEAVAQVRLMKGTGRILINGKQAQEYLHHNSCSILGIKAPFEILQTLDTSLKPQEIDTLVKVQGGGLIGQAEAIKLGVARAISDFAGSNIPDLRKNLKDQGYLTVDARIKERRKYGLKKARKASQYHKR